MNLTLGGSKKKDQIGFVFMGQRFKFDKTSDNRLREGCPENFQDSLSIPTI